MPFYNYKCKKCKNNYQDLAASDEAIKCPWCGTTNTAQIPSGATQTTLVTKDAWRGVKVPKGQEKALKKRMKNYQAKYEMAEMIEKNGIKAAKRHGWLDKIKKI